MSELVERRVQQLRQARSNYYVDGIDLCDHVADLLNKLDRPLPDRAEFENVLSALVHVTRQYGESLWNQADSESREILMRTQGRLHAHLIALVYGAAPSGSAPTGTANE